MERPTEPEPFTEEFPHSELAMHNQPDEKHNVRVEEWYRRYDAHQAKMEKYRNDLAVYELVQGGMSLCKARAQVYGEEEVGCSISGGRRSRNKKSKKSKRSKKSRKSRR